MKPIDYLDRSSRESKAGLSRKNIQKLTNYMKHCNSVNDFYIVEHLLNKGPATRDELVKETGIKRTTAHDALERLLGKGLVKKEAIKEGRGRPKVYWKISK
ncbi:MAG: helix-turn-helix domain-containing protein [Candidatus Hodarchaeales archaeon]|jgi:predicted transcriptional regulator